MICRQSGRACDKQGCSLYGMGTCPLLVPAPQPEPTAPVIAPFVLDPTMHDLVRELRLA